VSVLKADQRSSYQLADRKGDNQSDPAASADEQTDRVVGRGETKELSKDTEFEDVACDLKENLAQEN
jgi:hypothetical protein